MSRARFTWTEALLAACRLGFAAAVVVGCQSEAAPGPAAAELERDAGVAAGQGPSDVLGTPYDWQLPRGFPEPVIPPDNPMTVEKVELGRFLFYDRALSGNNNAACATCHLPELAFADGRVLPEGSTGDLVPRNSPGLANVAYRSTLTWMNPLLLTLEEQIPVPLFGEFPTELGANQESAAVLARFADSGLYQGLFEAAYGAGYEVTFDNIIDALACFCRSLISGTSPYDAYVQGDESAISESAKRGLFLFFEEKLECHHCHNGFDLTNAVRSERTRFEELAFFNTGLYNLDSEGRYPVGGEGLFEFTGDPADHGKFRTPSLRNVALTAPYAHDGSVATLEEMLQVYARGGRAAEGSGDGRDNRNKDGFVHGFELSAEELRDVLAFLEALTDEEFVRNPRHGDPFESLAP